MKVRILGSGTSTGVPVLGCQCEVCRSADPKNHRTRASILITTSHGHNILVDTPPEMRLQLLAAGVRELSAVIYTHMHADHTQGFDDLRAFYFHTKKPVPIYVLPDYEEEIQSRFRYAFEDTGYIGTRPHVDLRLIPNEPFIIEDQLIDPIILPHGNVRSCALRFGRFAYATDFKEFSKTQIDAWRGHVDTMVASGVHYRPHPTHSNIPETIELFKKLGVKKGILSHLSHEVDFTRDSKSLPDSVSFSYDGMKIDL